MFWSEEWVGFKIQGILDVFLWNPSLINNLEKCLSFEDGILCDLKHFGHQNLAHAMVSHKRNDRAGDSIFVKTRQLQVLEIYTMHADQLLQHWTRERPCVSNLMMFCINGPPLRLSFEPRKYIRTWLRSQCSVMDARRQGKVKKIWEAW